MLKPELQACGLQKKNKKLGIHFPQNRIQNEVNTENSFFTTCKDSFNHYLVNATLHGLKYVGDLTITRLER